MGIFKVQGCLCRLFSLSKYLGSEGWWFLDGSWKASRSSTLLWKSNEGVGLSGNPFGISSGLTSES